MLNIAAAAPAAAVVVVVVVVVVGVHRKYIFKFRIYV